MTEQTVMRNVGITPADVERRKRLVGLAKDDLARIAAIKPLIEAHVDELVDAFFALLATFDEAKVLLGYRELTNQVRELKRVHLKDMVSGNYDLGYVAYLDIGVNTDVLVHERERTIGRQSEAIRELSTPVRQIRERLLLMPQIGVIDTHRAQLITEHVLRAIRATRAKVVVIDVTGVAPIDSKVANHLVQTVTAARLMGAYAIVTGISAEVAQSMVALGVEMAPFATVGDLQGGVDMAEQRLGYRVTRVQ